ncbi:hypothetical protein HDU84_009865 [Entophlyctis sp. JEL0112]|nr:hypothetical protein HDU84_009865 [Entophlyctis sp. JEL0112]
MSNWWDAYPVPRSDPVFWTHDKVAELIRSSSVCGKDYACVDVRRTDYLGGTVKGATNAPAQTFYDQLGNFVEKYKNIPLVIFFCNSSSGRGPRCARWYQDALNDSGIRTSQGLILKGGIKEWVHHYGSHAELTEGYDEDHWKKEET